MDRASGRSLSRLSGGEAIITAMTAHRRLSAAYPAGKADFGGSTSCTLQVSQPPIRRGSRSSVDPPPQQSLSRLSGGEDGATARLVRSTFSQPPIRRGSSRHLLPARNSSSLSRLSGGEAFANIGDSLRTLSAAYPAGKSPSHDDFCFATGTCRIGTGFAIFLKALSIILFCLVFSERP